jgi:hypothetical protein
MSFSWRYEGLDGAPVGPGVAGSLPAEDFPTQADAESWIGETWQQLLDGGVDQVSLLEGDRVVYAGMSLHPAR